jgi:hypothetical protein
MKKTKQTEVLLTKTKLKNKQNWNTYNEKKQNILNRHLSSYIKQRKIKELRHKTYNSISKNFSVYREKKNILLDKNYNPDFILTKTQKLGGTLNKYFKIKKASEIDKIFAREFKKNNVRYIMLIVEIEVNGVRQMFSDVFTKEAFENLISQNVDYLENDETGDNEEMNEYLEGKILMTDLINKISFNPQYEGYEIINIFMRIIYEIPSTNKFKNKV